MTITINVITSATTAPIGIGDGGGSSGCSPVDGKPFVSATPGRSVAPFRLVIVKLNIETVLAGMVVEVKAFVMPGGSTPCATTADLGETSVGMVRANPKN